MEGTRTRSKQEEIWEWKRRWGLLTPPDEKSLNCCVVAASGRGESTPQAKRVNAAVNHDETKHAPQCPDIQCRVESKKKKDETGEMMMAFCRFANSTTSLYGRSLHYLPPLFVSYLLTNLPTDLPAGRAPPSMCCVRSNLRRILAMAGTWPEVVRPTLGRCMEGGIAPTWLSLSPPSDMGDPSCAGEDDGTLVFLSLMSTQSGPRLTGFATASLPFGAERVSSDLLDVHYSGPEPPTASGFGLDAICHDTHPLAGPLLPPKR